MYPYAGLIPTRQVELRTPSAGNFLNFVKRLSKASRALAQQGTLPHYAARPGKQPQTRLID